MQLRALMVVAFLGVHAACGSLPTQARGADLVVAGTEFSDWVWTEGLPIVVKVFEAERSVGEPQKAVITGGIFSVKFVGAVRGTMTCTVCYYIDKEQDGSCNGDDPGFSINVAVDAAQAPNTITLPPPDPQKVQNTCAWF